MDAVTRPERLNLSLPMAGAATGGGSVMLGFLLLPAWRLEQAVSASGIPAILAAAEPPLGYTARIALGLAFGGMVAAFAWFGLTLLVGDRPLVMPKWRIRFDMAKWSALLRRTTQKADGAPRPPLFANRELGTPFLDVKAAAAPPPERDLPLDLDQPLAAFDPAALPIAPLAAPEPLAPLAPAQPRRQLIDPGDRFETFELTPIQRAEAAAPPVTVVAAPPAPIVPPARVVTPATELSVHALLARLERGLDHTVPFAPSPAVAPVPDAVEPAVVPDASSIRTGSLQDTLGDLRRLAMGER